MIILLVHNKLLGCINCFQFLPIGSLNNKFVLLLIFLSHILVLSLFISELAISQDPYFSQYFASPMTLNPSLIGSDLKKESRLQMVTRNQWWGGNSKPYTTNMVSLEKRLGEKG